jgi:hypothetical protein
LPTTFESPNTVVCTIAATELSGTPFATLFVAPEYGLGTLVACSACFIAFAVIKLPKKLTVKT